MPRRTAFSELLRHLNLFSCRETCQTATILPSCHAKFLYIVCQFHLCSRKSSLKFDKAAAASQYVIISVLKWPMVWHHPWRRVSGIMMNPEMLMLSLCWRSKSGREWSAAACRGIISWGHPTFHEKNS